MITSPEWTNLYVFLIILAALKVVSACPYFSSLQRPFQLSIQKRLCLRSPPSVWINGPGGRCRRIKQSCVDSRRHSLMVPTSGLNSIGTFMFNSSQRTLENLHLVYRWQRNCFGSIGLRERSHRSPLNGVLVGHVSQNWIGVMLWNLYLSSIQLWRRIHIISCSKDGNWLGEAFVFRTLGGWNVFTHHRALRWRWASFRNHWKDREVPIRKVQSGNSFSSF